MPNDRAELWFSALQAELLEERAHALGRTGRRIDEQLDRCRALAARLDQAHRGDGSTSAALLDDYRAARSEFERSRWKLCVQREALGLHDHRWVNQIYPTPPSR